MLRCVLPLILVAACHSRGAMPPPAGPDQSVHDAMVLVCQAGDRAEADSDREASKSDRIAKHLTDGVGNARVLQTAEAWKTDGIKRTELDSLVKEARLPSCGLRDSL